MKWVFADGGRAEAGYRGDVRDCAVRAVAIATGQPYRKVYEDMNAVARKERPTKRNGYRRSYSGTGVYRSTFDLYMLALGGWRWVPTMGIGTGCKVHMKATELPQGRIIVRLSKHYAAVIDGVLHDTYDCTRGGTRCVYGYWVYDNS